jgi:hypothetical protein
MEPFIIKSRLFSIFDQIVVEATLQSCVSPQPDTQR